MSNIKKSVSDLVGNTPLIELSKISKVHGVQANIYGKLEMFNPGGSVKDRIAKAMIETAEKEGLLKPDSIIVEATSGNTGIGLAAIGVSKGYEVMIVMPESMSLERRKFLMGYGAQLILTDAALGMKGAIDKALELKKDNPKVFIPSQFENMSNPLAHYQTTGPEIDHDLDGKIDVLVAGVGTGGTISGIGRYLKEKNKNVEIIAVEPQTSAVLSGQQPGRHGIQGIGAGFIPTTYNEKVVDRIILVSDKNAIQMVRELGATEGLFVGISSGAALSVALNLGKEKQYENKNIVVILPDNGDRYLSTAVFE